ncbi:hypothetical protein GE09DRAFT_1136275 [Coniochaeta sp. 2T2.1]|nr:hypothetical protein GE09DRAFT_1136275 [Coniochaeta sp. 2T2.1]
MDTTTSAGHRKIELQSAEDFSYLIANLRRAAAEHISEAFPPVPPSVSSTSGPVDKEDELRVQIEQLVDEYITRTFTLAAPNLVVNGLPIVDPTPFVTGKDKNGKSKLAEPEEQHEPFDGRKRNRVMELVKQEEELLSEIAALKRKAPREAAVNWGEKVRSGVEGDERVLRETTESLVKAVGEQSWVEDERRKSVAPTVVEDGRKKNNTGVLGDVGPLERQEGVERDFAGVVEALGRLKGDMPAAVARMERARVAGEYVVTER